MKKPLIKKRDLKVLKCWPKLMRRKRIHDEYLESIFFKLSTTWLNSTVKGRMHTKIGMSIDTAVVNMIYLV